MDIKVTIERIFPEQDVVSKRSGETYKKYAFLAKTQEEYPKLIYITCFGEDKWKALNIVVNNTYNLGVDVSSRQFNDRYYTEVNCWRAILLTDAPNAPQPQPIASAPTTAPVEPSSTSKSDDYDPLPF